MENNIFNLLILININCIILLYLGYYNEIIHKIIHTIYYSTYMNIKFITYIYLKYINMYIEKYEAIINKDII